MINNNDNNVITTLYCFIAELHWNFLATKGTSIQPLMMIITNLQTATNSSRQNLAKLCTNVLNSYLSKAYTVTLLLPMAKKSLYKELLHNGNQRICISDLVANQSILRSFLHAKRGRKGRENYLSQHHVVLFHRK